MKLPAMNWLLTLFSFPNYITSRFYIAKLPSVIVSWTRNKQENQEFTPLFVFILIYGNHKKQTQVCFGIASNEKASLPLKEKVDTIYSYHLEENF